MRIILIFAVLVCGSVSASDIDSLIQEGISLHDQGEYDLAAEKYAAALKIDPNNSLALYELSYSYMVSGNNEECIKYSKKGSKLQSDLKSKFFVALGSCYSQSGKLEEAISTFDEAISRDPQNASLHLNIAVSLSNNKQDKEAISHLKEAIKYSNGYASPYFFIAEMYRTTNYKIPSLFFYMQFLLLEKNTKRTQIASRHIYTLLNQSVKKKDGGDMDLFFDPDTPKDEGDFSGLELALPMTIAAASQEDKNLSGIAIQTTALTDFMQISLEIKDEKLIDTFTWQYAAKNMVALQSSGDFNTLAYIFAEKAGMQGASEWLDSNPDKITKMSNAIKSL